MELNFPLSADDVQLSAYIYPNSEQQRRAGVPSLEPHGQEGTRSCPGYDAIDYTFSCHSYGRVVHLSKRNCNLQIRNACVMCIATDVRTL